MPAISGSLSKWINIVVAVLAAIVALGPHAFPSYVPGGWANDIVQTAAFAVAIWGAVNAALHAAPEPGVKAIALVAVLLAASFAFDGRAHAAPLKLHPRCGAGSLYIPCGGAAPKTPASNPFGALQTFTLADLQAALADAQAQNPPDARHAACWAALIPIVEANAPNPIPAGLGLAQLVQKTFDDQTLLFGHQAWKDTIAQACALTVVDLNSNLATLLAAAGLGAVVAPKLPAPF